MTLRERIERALASLMNCTRPDICGYGEQQNPTHVTGCRAEMREDAADAALDAVHAHIEGMETAGYLCHGEGVITAFDAESARTDRDTGCEAKHDRLIRADDMTERPEERP